MPCAPKKQRMSRKELPIEQNTSESDGNPQSFVDSLPQDLILQSFST